MFWMLRSTENLNIFHQFSTTSNARCWDVESGYDSRGKYVLRLNRVKFSGGAVVFTVNRKDANTCTFAAQTKAKTSLSFMKIFQLEQQICSSLRLT